MAFKYCNKTNECNIIEYVILRIIEHSFVLTFIRFRVKVNVSSVSVLCNAMCCRALLDICALGVRGEDHHLCEE